MKLELKNLTQNPGVYLFKNSKRQIIYVGKAINLKNRVSSYFHKNLQNQKTVQLVSEINSLEVVSVNSEIEALILEAKLIKKFQPRYNLQLKDDKDYLYIIFTKEDFPAVITGRKQDLVRAKVYFGPFPSSTAARTTLRFLRKILPFRVNCTPNSGRGCLSYHLGLCPGVCVGVISAKDYGKNLKRLKKFLNGETGKLLTDLESEIRKYSKNLQFEEAGEIQKKIVAIKHITQPVESVEKYLSGPQALESKYQEQLEDLKANLNLKTFPTRIECYDISNTSGTNATGSMVVLIDGQVAKNEYRRFKIKTVNGPNDPAMMKEVLSRRFKNKWPHPDLIILDGGKTQLSSGILVLAELGLTISLVGLAKKLEEIHVPQMVGTIRLKKNSPALYLMQRIRDEAHRFAITYHRYLRSKAFIPSKF